MSQLQVFNTLSLKKENFVPLNGNLVRMYACGPTVYDLSHLGHARMAITWDVIQRYLRWRGFKVTFVRNITDIDDKIINRAIDLGLRPEQVSREYTYTFWHDMHQLNVAPPDFEPRATEYVQPMMDFISGLIKSGHAYVSNNDVYFEVAKFKEYGKLKKQNPDDLLCGVREQAISQDQLLERKRNNLDFALWKGCANDNELGWDSPWGKGRPGWHIECSTMIKHVLGESIDIHGGGEDLIFPHHENEIAQSESLHGKALARYWLHNSFVQVDTEKMSKSLGNFKTIQDILNTYHPDTVRLFILQTHYRTPIEFESQALHAAQAGLCRLVKASNAIGPEEEVELKALLPTEAENAARSASFQQAMDNDFNTAAAVAVLFELADQIFVENDPKQRLIFILALRRLAGVLGLTLQDMRHEVTTKTSQQVIDCLLELREEARYKKDFATSDLIRQKLNGLGIKVMDESGQRSTWELV